MSLSPKTVRWLEKNCAVSLQGKTVLITGANSGVGYKEAETSLYLGAAVILACRNPERAAAAQASLLRDYPGASVTVMRLDLADFASIDAFAGTIAAQQTDIDVFVNNAGVFRHPGRKTADGFDLVIGTNYIGVYRLSEQLLPYLQTLPHEVVYINTISLIHKFVRKIRYAEFRDTSGAGSVGIYARSKLCLAKYSRALAERYRNTNIRVLMIHPGIAVTPLGANAFGPVVRRLSGVFGFLFNSPEKSSLSLAYMLSRNLPAGSVAGPVRCFGGWGYPKKNRVLRRVKEGAEELIRETERALSAEVPD